MDIRASQLLIPQPSRLIATDISRWKQGEILNATVIGRQSRDNVLLQVKSQLIEAQTQSPMPIKTGDVINLRVENTTSPVMLRLVDKPAVVYEQSRQQLVRENLPRQESLNRLTTIINHSSASPVKQLPVYLQQSLQRFIERLPTPMQIRTVAGIKNAIQDSGLFLEARLGKLATAINSATTSGMVSEQAGKLLHPDLKANLLQLSQVIKEINKQQIPDTFASNNPANTNTGQKISTNPGINKFISNNNAVLQQNGKGENIKSPDTTMLFSKIMTTESLAKQVEASVSRIENNQARAIQTEINPVPNWSVEVPVKNGEQLDLLTLNLERQGAQPEQDESGSYTVRLRIEFGDSGSLNANIGIYNGEIHADVWSEQAEFDHLINTNIEKLDKNLQARGLDIGRVEHRHHNAPNNDYAAPDKGLINITL